MTAPEVDLKTAIRQYLEVSDALLQHELRDGYISIEQAKRDTAEAEKWRELLAVLEAADILYGTRNEERTVST